MVCRSPRGFIWRRGVCACVKNVIKCEKEANEGKCVCLELSYRGR